MAKNIVKSTIPGKSLLYFQYNGGACLETKETSGLHHLWEHLMCETWAPRQDLITRNGIDWNAYTDAHRIMFYFQGLSRCMEEVIEAAVLNPGTCDITKSFPTKSQFETERRIILQEYDNAMNDRWEVLYNNIMRRHFSYYGAIGRREVLESVTYSEFMRGFSTWLPQSPSCVGFAKGSQYRPSHPIMSMISNPDHLGPEILQATQPRSEADFKPDVVSCGSTTDVILADTMIVPLTLVPRQVRFVIDALWTDGFDSPMCREFRHKTGIAYQAATVGSPVFPVLMSYVTMRPEDLKRSRKILHAMFRNWEKHITLQRFQDIKTMLDNQIQDREINTCTYSYMKRRNSAWAITAKQLNAISWVDVQHGLDAIAKLPWHEASFGTELAIA